MFSILKSHCKNMTISSESLASCQVLVSLLGAGVPTLVDRICLIDNPLYLVPLEDQPLFHSTGVVIV